MSVKLFSLENQGNAEYNLSRFFYHYLFIVMAKKITLVLIGLCLMPLLAMSVQAACTDADGDGYIVEKDKTTFDNCNTGPIQYKGYGDCFDKADPSVKDRDGKVVDPASVHPNAIEIVNDGVNQDCVGGDESFGADPKETTKVIDNIRSLLLYVVGGVSGVVLIIGGLMYATAAGNDTKLSKAKKTMLGALIGLAVAFLANVIIGLVAGNILG